MSIIFVFRDPKYIRNTPTLIKKTVVYLFKAISSRLSFSVHKFKGKEFFFFFFSWWLTFVKFINSKFFSREEKKKSSIAHFLLNFLQNVIISFVFRNKFFVTPTMVQLIPFFFSNLSLTYRQKKNSGCRRTRGRGPHSSVSLCVLRAAQKFLQISFSFYIN